MTIEQIKKEIYFAKVIIGATYHVQMPMLTNQEEKDVVRKALTKYVDELEDELRGR